MKTWNLLSLVHQMDRERGINPQNIYCIQTGHVVGTLDLEELRLACILENTDDDETLMDALETRTLMSMRPSVAWNSLDYASMNRLRLRAPRQLLSYLMIRCYEPRDKNGNLKISSDTRIQNYRSRVQMWHLIERLPISDKDLNELLVVLLRIDSMFNLNAVAVKSEFPAPATITDAESARGYIDAMWKWHDSLYGQWLKAERQNKLSNEFWSTRGNSVTRDASFRATVEGKPLTESTIKKVEAKKKDNEMLNLLQSIMDAAVKGEPVNGVEPIKNIVASKPSGYIPAGGLKLKFAGKR